MWKTEKSDLREVRVLSHWTELCFKHVCLLKKSKMKKKKEKGAGGKYLFVLISLRHISCSRNNFPHHYWLMQLLFYFLFTKRQREKDACTLWKRSKCQKYRNISQHTLFLKIFASRNCGFFQSVILSLSLPLRVHNIHNRLSVQDCRSRFLRINIHSVNSLSGWLPWNHNSVKIRQKEC